MCVCVCVCVCSIGIHRAGVSGYNKERQNCVNFIQLSIHTVREERTLERISYNSLENGYAKSYTLQLCPIENSY